MGAEVSRKTGKEFLFEKKNKKQKAVTLVSRHPCSVDFGLSWYFTTIYTFYVSGLKQEL